MLEPSAMKLQAARETAKAAYEAASGKVPIIGPVIAAAAFSTLLRDAYRGK